MRVSQLIEERSGLRGFVCSHSLNNHSAVWYLFRATGRASIPSGGIAQVGSRALCAALMPRSWCCALWWVAPCTRLSASHRQAPAVPTPTSTRQRSACLSGPTTSAACRRRHTACGAPRRCHVIQLRWGLKQLAAAAELSQSYDKVSLMCTFMLHGLLGHACLFNWTSGVSIPKTSCKYRTTRERQTMGAL